MIARQMEERLMRALDECPCVVILGPRQVGKTTLALGLDLERENVYLDLESESDMAKLGDAETYLQGQQGKLVIIDEAQQKPGLFKVLRGVIDKNRREGHRNGQFLVLGSATNELLHQTSESLAGRVRYLELSGLNVEEVDAQDLEKVNSLWVRGGFPDSYLSKNDAESYEWRRDFIRTYLERDIPQLGPRIPATTLRRLWTMLAHVQGQGVNMSELGKSLEVSSTTVHRYIDVLSDLLLVRKLEPWYENVKKRLVKSPKVYIRDSGVVHSLLGIQDYEALLGHPAAGGSWEGFVIENLLSAAPRGTMPYYYRTSAGAEIDLILEMNGQERWAIEIKRTGAPKLKRGFYTSRDDIKANRSFLVYTGQERYEMGSGVICLNLRQLVEELNSLRQRSK